MSDEEVDLDALLLEAYTSIKNIEEDPIEFTQTHLALLDLSPLSAIELSSNTLSAPKELQYLITLAREQQLPVPMVAPLSPLIALYKHRKARTRQYYTCKIMTCLNRYRTMDELLQHYSQAHPGKTFNCEVCREPYLKIDSLRKHRRYKHGLEFNRHYFLNQYHANDK